MNKIIFLDFNGVLNTEHYQSLLKYQGKPWRDEYGAFFDPNAGQKSDYFGIEIKLNSKS